MAEAPDDAVLRFAHLTGALGIGLLNVIEIASAPTWQEVELVGGGRDVLPMQLVARRSTVGWSRAWVADHKGMRGGVLGEPVFPEGTSLRARVLKLGEFGGVDEENYELFVERWFPEAGEPGWLMPTPLSEEFWRQYAEDAHEVYTFCGRFIDGLATLSELKKAPSKTNAFLRWLRMMVADTRIVPQIVRGTTVVERWVSLTLVGAIASRALRELLPKRIVRRCICGCGRIFLSDDPRKRFFDKGCADANRQRRYRGREAVPLHPDDVERSRKVKAALRRTRRGGRSGLAKKPSRT